MNLPEKHILNVIAVCSNPQRYESRYRLFKQFAEKISQSQRVKLLTVEHTHGDRLPLLNADVTVSGSDEIWLKEVLCNVGIRHLPHDWKYVAWVDADIQFPNDTWAVEALHQLQHYQIVQLFESCADLGPSGRILQVHQGFASQYRKGAPRVLAGNYYGSRAQFWHPGFGWACTREFYENVGGLLDWAILGAADHHMALGLIGEARSSVPGNIHPNYLAKVLAWERSALKIAHRDMGFVPGTILHHWHGPKNKRFYEERWKILERWNFDPESDLYKDSQGLWCLFSDKPGMRDDLRNYFKARDEDSMEEG